MNAAQAGNHDADRETPGRHPVSVGRGLSSRDEDQRIMLSVSQTGSESTWQLANTESIAATTSNIDLHFI
jgi:hypothetical protein